MDEEGTSLPSGEGPVNCGPPKVGIMKVAGSKEEQRDEEEQRGEEEQRDEEGAGSGASLLQPVVRVKSFSRRSTIAFSPATTF